MRGNRLAVGALGAVLLMACWAVIAKDQDPRGKFKVGNTTFKNQAAFAAAGARCGTPNPTPAMRNAARKALLARPAIQGAALIVIPVQFIHLTSGSQGQISDQQRVDQIAVLNDAYNAYGFQFCYDPNLYPAKVVDNTAWYHMGHDTQAEIDCKTELHEDTSKFLNLYTCSPGGGLLGWATFPFPSVDPNLDGVVCLDESLPGGNADPYNEGDTATHEVGHWLGLFHTFQDGCSPPGDEVADTQSHANPDFGCPNSAPSCNPPASSPVHNFMNYVDDPCMDEFTAGQGVRMVSTVATFRPSLGSLPCVNFTDPGGCTLSKLSGLAKKLIPFPLSQNDMDSLRQFRDVVLKRSDAGRSLADLYYRHGDALTDVMLKNPQLAGEAMMFLARQLSAVERSIERDGDVHLAAKDFDLGMNLLQRFRAAAPNKLADALMRVEGLIQEVATTHEAAGVVSLHFPTAPIAEAPLRTKLLKPIPDPISTPQ